MAKKNVSPKSLANLRPFGPGHQPVSPGRKPIPEEVKQALIAATPEATKVLLELLHHDDAKIRIRAVEVIYDRAYGKAAAQVNVNVTDVGSLHLQLLEEIRARRQERLGDGAIDVTPIEEKKTEEGA